MAVSVSSIGAFLSEEAHMKLKKYGPVSTVSSLILSCLARQIPRAGQQIQMRIDWSGSQVHKTAEILGDNPFPLAGTAPYRVATESQKAELDQASLFELVSLEFLCLRKAHGKIDPPKISRDKGVGLTLRVEKDALSWWQKQFTHTQPGISHILMASLDWITLTFEEDLLRRIETYSDILEQALANATISEAESLTWAVRTKIEAFAFSHSEKARQGLFDLTVVGLPEFVSLCLILKYGYGSDPKKTVSPRVSAGTVAQLTDLFGNKNTGVAFAAETFPQMYYATFASEIQGAFTPDELEELSHLARKYKIPPPQGEHPGLALWKMIQLPQAKSYKDRIEALSPFGKLCLEVAVISCHFVREGPSITIKKSRKAFKAETGEIASV